MPKTQGMGWAFYPTMKEKLTMIKKTRKTHDKQ
jgi:hypothetical protein